MASATDVLSQLAQPGMATITLKTPLGIYWVDPFAPSDPTFNKVMSMLGISMDLHAGGPTQDELNATQLSTGLVFAGLVVGFLGYEAYQFWQRRSNPPRRVNPPRRRRRAPQLRDGQVITV